MSDSNDHNHEPLFLNAIDNAVIAYSQSPVVLFALKLAYTGRKWIFS
jgi:hypothetical protein